MLTARVAEPHVAAWRKGRDPEAFDAELMVAIEAAAGRRVEMAG